MMIRASPANPESIKIDSEPAARIYLMLLSFQLVFFDLRLSMGIGRMRRMEEIPRMAYRKAEEWVSGWRMAVCSPQAIRRPSVSIVFAGVGIPRKTSDWVWSVLNLASRRAEKRGTRNAGRAAKWMADKSGTPDDGSGSSMM